MSNPHLMVTWLAGYVLAGKESAPHGDMTRRFFPRSGSQLSMIYYRNEKPAPCVLITLWSSYWLVITSPVHAPLATWTGYMQFGSVLARFGETMDRLRFQFFRFWAKNWTEPDLKALHLNATFRKPFPVHLRTLLPLNLERERRTKF
jgi:hypothetical protein